MAVATETSQKFAEALNAKFNPRKEVTVEAGRKYDRVVIGYSGEYGGSAHAFVERETGKLYKAAGWSAPAKGVRYDLSTAESFANTVELADPYGSYLYAR